MGSVLGVLNKECAQWKRTEEHGFDPRINGCWPLEGGVKRERTFWPKKIRLDEVLVSWKDAVNIRYFCFKSGHRFCLKVAC